MESVEDFVLEMKDNDHIVLTFNNEIQFKEIVTAFVKPGIDRNEINVLIIYRKEEQKFLQSLAKKHAETIRLPSRLSQMD